MNYQELKKLIQQHNIAYYDKAAPTITDSEWDQLYDKLEAMEKAKVGGITIPQLNLLAVWLEK